MKGRMLFIFNPRSGKGQIRNKLVDIIDVFVKGGYEVVVHPTQGAKDAEKMAKNMAEEVDLIVCSGGDGTLDEVVTGLMEIGANVPLGYIPAMVFQTYLVGVRASSLREVIKLFWTFSSAFFTSLTHLYDTIGT